MAKDAQEAFRALPSDAQKRLLESLKKFSKQLQDSGDRVPWLKWRIWYRDETKTDRKDWMYVFAQNRKQAEELANWTRKQELSIIDVEIVP